MQGGVVEGARLGDGPLVTGGAGTGREYVGGDVRHASAGLPGQIGQGGQPRREAASRGVP